MDDNGTAKPGTTGSALGELLAGVITDDSIKKSAIHLLEDIARDTKRIADALEAQPSLRDQMAMALLIRGKSNFRDVYKQANEVLAIRQKEE